MNKRINIYVLISISLFIIGMFLLISSTLKIKNRDIIDLYTKNMSEVKLEEGNLYQIESEHVEILGDYFCMKNEYGIVDKEEANCEYYYNLKITNKYNQRYYIILKADKSTKDEIQNGDNVKFEGKLYNIQDKEVQELQKKSLRKLGVEANIHCVYLKPIPKQTFLVIISIGMIISSIVIILIGRGKIDFSKIFKRRKVKW